MTSNILSMKGFVSMGWGMFCWSEKFFILRALLKKNISVKIGLFFYMRERGALSISSVVLTAIMK